MRSISQAKPQVKLQINIQKQKNLQLTRGLSCPPKDDPLNEKSELDSKTVFSEEEQFLYETSIAPKEFAEKYQIIGHLGKGAQGEVFKLKETKSGEFFAGKFYFSNDPELIVQINFEKEIISSLSHPNIITYKDFFQNSETNCRILITEFFDAIPFNEFVVKKELNIEEINVILSQIISGLFYLHDQGILHQDFNVKNILINPETHIIKIIDFGISQKVSKQDDFQLFDDIQGNFKFRAPKRYHTETQNCYFSDIWGLCLIVFSLFMKKALSSKEALQLNLIDENKITSPGLRDLLEKSNKNTKIQEFLDFFERRWEENLKFL